MSKPSIVSFMYHELELPGRPICQDEPGYSRYVLRASDFRTQMEFLKANGWRGLSVGQSLSYPEGRCITITFDDGCETDLIAAAPILRDFGFNATFFITSGRLETRGYLSHIQLQELSASGSEIGCHSMTHSYLTDLDEQGLRREICDSKTQLEQIIGRSVDHFSCPGGRYDQRVVATARAAGYQSVSTSLIRANSSQTDPFSLGRVAMFKDCSLQTFSALCAGKGLARMRAQSFLRGLAKRALGNSIYDGVRARILHRSD